MGLLNMLRHPIRSCAIAMPVMVLVSCGQTGVHDDTEAAAPSESVSAQDAARSQIRANYQEWAGSSSDFQAANVVVAYANNGGYYECLRKLNRDYSWKTSIALVSPTVDDGTWGTRWLAPTHSAFFTDKLRVDAIMSALASRMNNVDLTAEENQQDLLCIEKNPTPADSVIEEIRSPKGLAELQKRWDSAMRQVSAELPSTDAYLQCLDSYGIPGHPKGAPGDPLDDFYGLLNKSSPDWHVIAVANAREASAEWRDVLSLEQEFLTVDSACRNQYIEMYLPLVLEISETFALENAREIRALRGSWEAIRERATTLGWSLDEPFAGDTTLFMSDPLRGVNEEN